MKRFTFPLIFFILLSSGLNAQLKLDTLGWIPPVDIPIYLSGNFAELRTGHFHAGIDIKTQGKEGAKLYAVQDGYISRIKVSSGGYGKAIYITHPDGYTSVYAHLKEYNIQLEKYVRSAQYARQNYNVDIFPEKGELTVKQGDVIGLSGNSGSSAGPHLHFEIRDTKNSRPLNGLFLGYDIEDNIPPKMEYLYVYPMNELGMVNYKSKKHYYSLKKVKGGYALRQGDTLQAFGSIGLGLKVNDYLNGSANRCGVYELKGYVDDTLFFHEKLDGVSFSETRYINSHMDYEENVQRKRKLHKMHIDPNNKLSIYLESKNRGVLFFSPNKPFSKIRIEAVDAYMNKSELEFVVQSKNYNPKLIVNNNQFTIPWQQAFSIDTMGLSLSFNKESFYDTLLMEFSVDTTNYPNTFSSLYSIHNAYTPIHKPYNISIKYDSVPTQLEEKLLLAVWYKDKFNALGGIVEEGMVKGRIRDLGMITVVMDTVAPTIVPLGRLKHTHELNNLTEFKFLIEDDFSGIWEYNGYINDQWVLFEYDAKNDLITYQFDDYMPTEGLIELKIEVTDERGNTAEFVKEFEIYSEQDHDIGQ